MAAAKKGSSKCVFVGNIPYDATEEKLTEIFNGVGPVVTFRLVVDRDTGKPKGFGFCEFRDHDTALSAIRNLNNYELGNRPLRLGWPSRSDMAEVGNNSMHGAAVGGPGAAPAHDRQPAAATGAGDPLIDYIHQLPKEQLQNFLHHIQAMAIHEPDKAGHLMEANPHLGHAVLIAAKALDIMLPPQPASGPPPAHQPPVPHGAPIPPRQGFQPPPGQVPFGQDQGLPPYGHIPPVSAIPPSGPPAIPPQAPPPEVDERALLAQVMSFTQEQINSLPPAERQQIMELRERMRAHTGQ